MWTFKLDKFSGQVYQLVHNKNDELVWDLMAKGPNPANTVVVSGKVNYQIFTSGIAAKFTILIGARDGFDGVTLHKGFDRCRDVSLGAAAGLA